MRISIDRLMQSLEAMWQIGATPNGGVTRLALTDEDRDGRNLLRFWFTEAGLEVRVDDFGNMYARRAGKQDLPPVLVGSHADTVPQGGRYDGILGVLSALEVVRSLNDAGIETERPIEIVNWTAEEGSRFSPPLFGSTAALNEFAKDEALNTRDDAGVRFGDELERIGYAGQEADRITDASAYLELHIEQGPVLEAEGHPVGLVQGIIAQSWQNVRVVGKPGHAGSTPMELRSDSLAAAAELILKVRELTMVSESYAVGTVGKISVEPGAQNVIPAETRFTVDLRCADADNLVQIDRDLRLEAKDIEGRHAVSVEISGIGKAETAAFDAGVMDVIRSSIEAEGLAVREMWSGPGHDAHPASHLWPTGMIFVRSRDGLSHAEAEYSSPEDIAAATAVLLRTALTLAQD